MRHHLECSFGIKARRPGRKSTLRLLESWRDVRPRAVRVVICDYNTGEIHGSPLGAGFMNRRVRGVREDSPPRLFIKSGHTIRARSPSAPFPGFPALLRIGKIGYGKLGTPNPSCARGGCLVQSRHTAGAHDCEGRRPGRGAGIPGAEAPRKVRSWHSGRRSGFWWLAQVRAG